MKILLSPAKTMNSIVSELPLSKPLFQNFANDIAVAAAQKTVEEIKTLMGVNDKIALENFHRFQNFFNENNSKSAAILSYTGVVFKYLDPKSLTFETLQYANEHLRFTSFLYGLLKPFDGIKQYRMEGNIRFPELGEKSLFEFWKPILSPIIEKFIGNKTFLFLASEEMKQLFDWKKIKTQYRTIQPEFKIEKNGQLKSIVIYTKMARGAMTRFVLKNKIQDPENLKTFEWEGFHFREDLSSESNFIYTL